MKPTSLFLNTKSDKLQSPSTPRVDSFGFCCFTVTPEFDADELIARVNRHPSSPKNCAKKLLNDAAEAYKYGHHSLILRINESQNAMYILGNKGVRISDLTDEDKDFIVSILNDFTQLDALPNQ